MVLAEALDRVSRDQADVATLYKHLQFAGVTLVTLAEGEISELHVGLKGTMNALFLKDPAKKTHRGMRGRVEQGKAGGGLCYGYDVVRPLDGNGNPVTGERTINGAEADVVRRVFRDFASGLSPKTIALRLNATAFPARTANSVPREDRGDNGQLWFTRPARLTCTTTGRSHKRITAWCSLADGRDVNCAAIRAGVVVRWERYDRGGRLEG